MYRIVICDDNASYAKSLKDEVNTICEEEGISFLIRVFDYSDELVEEIISGKLADIYILDISMPVYSGMDIVKLLNQKAAFIKIILLTAYSKYAIEACNYDVFRYIPKAEKHVRLKTAIQDAVSLLAQAEGHTPYIIENQNKYIRFFQEDILYLYKDRKYVCFVLKDGTLCKERGTLQDVFEKITHPAIQVLDRGYIVNILHVKSILTDRIRLDNGTELHTANHRAMRFRKVFHRYWETRI